MAHKEVDDISVVLKCHGKEHHGKKKKGYKDSLGCSNGKGLKNIALRSQKMEKTLL